MQLLLKSIRNISEKNNKNVEFKMNIEIAFVTSIHELRMIFSEHIVQVITFQ